MYSCRSLPRTTAIAGDMAEVQRLQRRLHELQRGAAAAFKALAQQQQHRQQRRQGAAVKGEAQLGVGNAYEFLIPAVR